MSIKIKVLVVDDSKIYRGIIREAIGKEDDIDIIGEAFNGKKALAFINEKQVPDLVTLDIEMPEMDGLETLKAIMTINKDRHPDAPDIGVLMVSTLSKPGAELTLNCLEMGAFDFVCKPNEDTPEENLNQLRDQLLSKMRIFYYRGDRLSLLSHVSEPARPVRVAVDVKKKEIRAIVIGVSTGGPKTLSKFLPELTNRTDIPIFIVQHMPPLYTLSMSENLDRKCRASVTEAGNNINVSSGTVYIAPGDKHLIVKKNSDGLVVTELSDAPPENNCKPAVDILFRSAALTFGNACIAVILTGMGNDGTAGLKPLKRKGVHVIVQDEETSVVWGMPGNAVEAGLTDDVLPIDNIASRIDELIQERKLA